MKTVTFTINNVSRQANATWDGAAVNLVQVGTTSQGAVQTTVGVHTYGIVVFGNPGDHWNATVSAPGSDTQSPNGVMDANGRDNTGNVSFEVKA